jgi:hypothetical protein
MRSLSRTFSGKSRHDDQIEPFEADDSSDSDSVKTKVEDWRLADDVKDFQLNDPTEGRRLGVTWSGLTVKVVPSDAQLQENVISQFNIPQQIKESRQKPELKTILDSSFGCVRPGEMLLVLVSDINVRTACKTSTNSVPTRLGKTWIWLYYLAENARK